MTDIVVGTKAPEREFGPMTAQMFVRYSGASGDLNPMHYDGDFARKAGYRGVFSQGMHVAALLGTFATDWLGPQNVRRFLVRFRDQIYIGDIVTCQGEVVAVTPVDEGRKQLVTVQLTGLGPNSVVAVTGEADFLLPS